MPPLGDRHGMLYSGTLVASGTATGLVVATGSGTELGRISALLATVQSTTTPLLRQMARFSRAGCARRTRPPAPHRCDSV